MEFEEYVDEQLRWWAPLNTNLLEEDAFLNYMLDKRLNDENS